MQCVAEIAVHEVICKTLDIILTRCLCLQLAVLERGERVEEEPSTSGRSFEEAQKPSAASQVAWMQSRLGLMSGLDATTVLWAILTESNDALLAICSNVVGDHLIVWYSFNANWQ